MATGTTTINITLSKKEDFYSKFSSEKLNNYLIDFILDECYGENYKNNIIINIHSKVKLENEEKHRMMDIIRRTYGLRVQDEIYRSEKSQNKKTILLLVGIALIIIYYCFKESVMKEMIYILGWIAIWESVSSILFDTKNDFMTIKRLKELSKARVYFYEDESIN